MQSITEIYKKYPGRVRHLALDIQVQGQKSLLPDDSILRDNYIVGLFITPNAAGTIRSGITQRVLVDSTTQDNSYLTLKCLNDSVLQDIPLSLFRANDNDTEVFPLDMKKLTPSQSYIYIANSALADTAESFYLNFFYVINS